LAQASRNCRRYPTCRKSEACRQRKISTRCAHQLHCTRAWEAKLDSEREQLLHSTAMFHRVSTERVAWPTPPLQPFLVGGNCLDSHMPFQFSSDPYRELDDISRGCVLDMEPSAPAADSPTLFRQLHGACFEIFPHEGAWGKHGPPRAVAQESAAASPTFWASARPPSMALASRVATSVVLESASAAEAAACMYQFIATKLTAVITRVKPESYSVKAEVFHEVAGCPSHCSLKAQVFEVPVGPGGELRVVVEFCRRYGDAVAFSRVFRQASRHLSGCFEWPQPEAPATAEHDSAPPPLLEACPQQEPGLQPLVAMLGCAPLQAEALAALATLAAASTAGAAAVCAALAELEGLLAELLASGRFEVSHPAAWLAAELTRHGCSEVDRPCFLDALKGIAIDGAELLAQPELAGAAGLAKLRRGAGLQ